MGSSSVRPKMDHLVCFLPGVLALGATRGEPYADVHAQFTDDDRANWKVRGIWDARQGEETTGRKRGVGKRGVRKRGVRKRGRRVGGHASVEQG